MSLERIVIDNIKRIRKEKNISQEKLAEYCGTSTSYIGLMETYRNVPKLSTIERIAAALNVPAQALFEDEGNTAADNAESEKQAQTAAARAKIKRDIMQEFEARLDRILEML